MIALIDESAAGWGTGANSDIGSSAKLASIELAGIKVVQVSESVIKKYHKDTRIV